MKSKSKKDPESQQLLKSRSEDPHLREPIDEQEKRAIIPLAGGVSSISIICSTIFTIFLTLEMEGVIEWNWWITFSPILFLLFVLLVLTQSRRLSTRFPLISRIAWLMCVICMIAFIVLLCFKFNGMFANKLQYRYVFTPLYVLFASASFLGFTAVIVSVFFSATEKRKSKYLTAGLPLIIMNVICFPFVVLLELKLEGVDADGFSWSYVFIPLFITDGFFLCTGGFLLLFTVGARESALFAIPQLACFLLALPASVVFKVLLISYLDGGSISAYLVMLPLFIVETFLLACGLHMLKSKST